MQSLFYKFTATLLISISLLAAVSIIAAPKIHAVDSNPIKTACDKSGADSPVCKDGTSDPIAGKDGIILKASRLVGIAVGIVSIIMIMLGGFTYVTSTGDPQKINGAKNTILYAIIGLVVAMLSQFIVAFVVSRTL